MARSTKLELGGETVKLTVPLQAKGQPWTLQARPVRYFPEIGETAADAETFAQAIADSLRAMHDRHGADMARPSVGFDVSAAPRPLHRHGGAIAETRPVLNAYGSLTVSCDGVWADRDVDYQAPCAWSEVAPAPAVPARGSYAKSGDPQAAYIAERAAAWNERRGKVAKEPAKVAPRARKVATVVDYSAPMPAGFTVADPFGALPPVAEPVQDRTYAEAIAAAPDRATVTDQLAAVRAAESIIAPDAPAAEPEPETRCRQYLHTQGGTRRCVRTPDYHDGAHEYEAAVTPIGPRAEPEPIAAPAETVAPVLAAGPARQRPTCERCGQTFRMSGSGYAWHVANNPDCASRRVTVAA